MICGNMVFDCRGAVTLTALFSDTNEVELAHVLSNVFKGEHPLFLCLYAQSPPYNQNISFSQIVLLYSIIQIEGLSIWDTLIQHGCSNSRDAL